MTRLSSILLLTVIALSGCKPLQLYTNVPEGPDEYVHGYEDGCDTAVSVSGDFWHKMFYGLTKDPAMTDNNLYKQGWNEGFAFCRGYYSSLKSEGGVFGEKGWLLWSGDSGIDVYANE